MAQALRKSAVNIDSRATNSEKHVGKRIVFSVLDADFQQRPRVSEFGATRYNR